MSDMRQRWLLIGGIGSVLLLLIGYFLIISPARGQLDELNVAIADQEAKNQQLTAKLAQLKSQVAEVPAKIKEVRAVQAKMPASMEQPALVRSLEQAAGSAGVSLTNISASTPTAIEGAPGNLELVGLPYTMNATGSYSQLKTFVSGLEQLERAFLLTTLTVAGGSDDTGSLTLDVAGRFFSLENLEVTEPTNLPAAEPTPAPKPEDTPTPAPTAKNKDKNKDKQKAQAAAKKPKKNGKKN